MLGVTCISEIGVDMTVKQLKKLPENVDDNRVVKCFEFDITGNVSGVIVYAACIANGGEPAACRRSAAYGRRASEYIHDAAPTIGGYLEKADPRNWNG